MRIFIYESVWEVTFRRHIIVIELNIRFKKWIRSYLPLYFVFTVVRKFAILVSFGILVVFMALELQANARVWYFL